MRSSKVLVLFAALSAVMWIMPCEAGAQEGSVSYQRFYDDLSPYGTWVENPNYGYVWIPSGISGFSPYATGGRWVLTNDGWTWDSDYPWGWAAFHYGRWDYDNASGWFWIPDNEWGPAWVSWRRSPGYYGWAPLRPGISINIAVGRDYHESNERWVFVRDRDFMRHDLGGRYINRNRNVTMINNSTVIVNTHRDDTRNVTYIAGPERNEVQRVTHRTVAPVAIRETAQPGGHLGHGEMGIYRPQVQKSSAGGQTPAPSKVMKMNEVRPSPENVAANHQEQPRRANPSAKIQPRPASASPQIQHRQVNKSPSPMNTEVQHQPRTVTPPNRIQPQKPRSVSLQKPKARMLPVRKPAPPPKNIRVQPQHPNPPEPKEKKEMSQ